MNEPLSIGWFILLGVGIVILAIAIYGSLQRGYDGDMRISIVAGIPCLVVLVFSMYVGYIRMLESQSGIQTEVYYPVKVFKNGDQTGTILLREGNELVERKLEGSIDKIIETVDSPKVVCQGYEPYRRGGWTCTAYVKVEDLPGGSYTYKSGKVTRNVPVTDYGMEN